MTLVLASTALERVGLQQLANHHLTSHYRPKPLYLSKKKKPNFNLISGTDHLLHYDQVLILSEVFRLCKGRSRIT